MEIIAEPKNKVKTDISIIIDKEPFFEMMAYAHKFSPNECSGIGVVERQDYTNGSVEFTIKKVFVPNQKNTPSTTDVEAEETARMVCVALQEGFDPSALKVHWHSHVDMDTFHSNTDTDNYNDLDNGDFLISLVVNKKGEMLASVHIYRPLRIDVLNVLVNAPEYDETEIPEGLKGKIEATVQRVLDFQTKDEVETNELYKMPPCLVSLLRAGEGEGLLFLYEEYGEIVGFYDTESNQSYYLECGLDPYGWGGRRLGYEY